MKSTSPWSVETSQQVDELILESVRSTGDRRRLAALAGQAIEQLINNGLGANGVKKLNDVDLYEIRVGDYRLYLKLVGKGSRTIAVSVLAPKLTGQLPTKTYRTYERRVDEHIAEIRAREDASSRRADAGKAGRSK